jgi:hypothetical protein
MKMTAIMFLAFLLLAFAGVAQVLLILDHAGDWLDDQVAILAYKLKDWR